MKNLLNSLLNILLVDDDPVSNFLAKKNLEKLGFKQVKTVENGQEALDYLDYEAPDLLFLDLNMPVMDGLEFLRQTKEKDLLDKIRVIVLTSSIRPEDKAKSLHYENVLDYVEKPLNEEKIENLLFRLSKEESLKDLLLK